MSSRQKNKSYVKSTGRQLTEKQILCYGKCQPIDLLTAQNTMCTQQITIHVSVEVLKLKTSTGRLQII